MTAVDLRLLPFADWSIEPAVDEHAVGWFTRLVAHNANSSARVHANEMGANGRHPVPAEHLATVLRLPLRAEWRERLISATPTVDVDRVVLCGQTIGLRQWSLARRRFCPGCLAESPHHRNWWDLTFVRQCPFHDHSICETGPDGTDVRWWWPHISSGLDGSSLARRMPRVQPLRTWEGYVLGRLGYAGRIECGLLDSVSLREIASTIELVGRLLTTGLSKTAPRASLPNTHSIGFQALCDGGKALTAALSVWVRAEVLPQPGVFGVQNAFGWFHAHLPTLTSLPLRRTIEAAMSEALLQCGRASDRTCAASGGAAESLGSLARSLGLNIKGVVSIAKRVGALSEADSRSHPLLTDSQISAIRTAVDDLVAHPRVSHLVGIAPSEFGLLVRKGHITPVRKATGGGERCIRYFRHEVQGLIRSAYQAVRPHNTRRAIGLVEYGKLTGERPGEVVSRVLSGSLVPTGLHPRQRGFKALVFCIEDAEQEQSREPALGRVRLSSGNSQTEVTRAQAGKLLGCTHETVLWMIEQGILTIRSDRRGGIDADSAQRAASIYAPASLYAPVLNCNRSSAAKRLASLGATLVVDAGEDRRRTTLVKRAEVRQLLGLCNDPDEVGTVEEASLWAETRDAIRAGCHGLVVPEYLKGGKGTVTNSRRTVMISVETDSVTGRFLFTFECNEAKSPRRWRRFLEVRDRLGELMPGVEWVVEDGRATGVVHGTEVAEFSTAIHAIISALS